MPKLIPDGLYNRYLSLTERLKQRFESLKNFDWRSLRHLSKEDVVRKLKEKGWRKPAGITAGVLVALLLVKGYLIPSLMRTYHTLDVDVVTVQPMMVPLQSELVGEIRSPQSVVIYTRVSGFLEKQLYQEGSWVNEGDILFEMDKRPFIAQVDLAKAALAAQEAALQTATLTLNRVKPLSAAKALSQQDLDNAVGNFQRAKAGVDQARAALETAQLNLDYCTIRSPISGLASVRKQALGSFLAAGSPNSELTTITEMNPMWVYFSLSQAQIQSINNLLEQKQLAATSLADVDVTVSLTDGALYPHVGKIGFTDVLYNVETGTRLVRAVFPNPDYVLKQGQFVTASIIGLNLQDVYLVPQAAVQQNSQGAFVWVVDGDDRVHTRSVTPGNWNGPNWVISGGLNPGERVVISNILRMSQNQRVSPNEVKAPQPEPVRLPPPVPAGEQRPSLFTPERNVSPTPAPPPATAPAPAKQ